VLSTAVVLAHEFVTAAGARPTRSLILLHGILGSGQNLRTLARRFVEAHPEWTGVLVDLRRHGRSLETSGDDSLQGAADDVDALARTLALPPDGVVGHSFGGKVALAWLGTGRSSLKHVVVIDSNPGPRPDARGSEGTLAVVDDLASLAHAAFAPPNDGLSRPHPSHHTTTTTTASPRACYCVKAAPPRDVRDPSSCPAGHRDN
jgi:pimeloyl-ACP methyl ester carboxylesterase